MPKEPRDMLTAIAVTITALAAWYLLYSGGVPFAVAMIRGGWG